MYVTFWQLVASHLAVGISFGAMGYYLSHRGWVGVKSDLKDIKTDVKKVKAKL